MNDATITHLACIMDGNRRFAKKHGKPPWWGHEQGARVIWSAIDFCIVHNIRYLSLYTFSLENFNRDQQEQERLFALLVEHAQASRAQLAEKQIRIHFVGDKERFPESVLSACNTLERETGSYNVLQINIMFCYSARREIISSISRIHRDIQKGALLLDQIDELLFQDYLWTAGIPDPDLIIRTGGLQRLSNFLLYQASYSELYFLDIFWPEITTGHLQQAVDFFCRSKRNFGG